MLDGDREVTLGRQCREQPVGFLHRKRGHKRRPRYTTVGAERQLAMDSMPVAGRSETSPLDPEAFVTDSAAGGTAIAAGVKTFNDAVGIDAEENPVQTVLERAREGSALPTPLRANTQGTPPILVG